MLDVVANNVNLWFILGRKAGQLLWSGLRQLLQMLGYAGGSHGVQANCWISWAIVREYKRKQKINFL